MKDVPIKYSHIKTCFLERVLYRAYELLLGGITLKSADAIANRLRNLDFLLPITPVGTYSIDMTDQEDYITS